MSEILHCHYLYIGKHKIFMEIYLNGFTAVNRNLSPKPLSNHNVFPRSESASQNDSSWTPMLMLVELGGTIRSLFWARVMRSPFPSKSWFNTRDHSHGFFASSEYHRRNQRLHRLLTCIALWWILFYLPYLLQCLKRIPFWRLMSNTYLNYVHSRNIYIY